jgi:uncharacterized protein YjbI with pentapeptide repeats
MPNFDALKAAQKGTAALEQWQAENSVGIDLSNGDLSGCDLRWMNFAGANLKNANFSDSILTGAYFGPSYFQQKPPHVTTKETPATLDGAIFDNAILLAATFNYSELQYASFREAYLGLANFRRISFKDNSFAGAQMASTILADCDLRGIHQLDSVIHFGPSHLDIATLEKSQGVSRTFLRQTGNYDNLIDHLPNFTSQGSSASFYSCFLSHSTKDKEFCDALYRNLTREGVRVWYAPKDIRGGQQIVPQITKALSIHDKVIIVLSHNSLNSQWVCNEIKWARRREARSKVRSLFPIRLIPFDTLQSWELIDSDTGLDVAAEVRSYFVPDFCDWHDQAEFEAAFRRLLRDLIQAAQ